MQINEQNKILPLYIQVKNHVISLIENGFVNSGEKLPSEKDLIDQFGVSRVTVRRALQELSYEEKIISLPGKGSYVLKPKIEPLSALTSFSENMRAQGYTPSYDKVRISIEIPSPSITNHLQLLPGSQVIHINRLMLADELPMAIQDAYLPFSIYELNPSLFRPEILANISMYKMLELELGIKLVKAEEWVDASKANQDESVLLSIDQNDSILIIKRKTFSLDERTIEYVKLIFPANRYRYKVVLFRP